MRQPAFSRQIPFVLLVIALLTLATSGQAQKPASKSALPAQLNAAPDFALESLLGETVHLSDFRGKIVLLYFWATWCGPCKIEMPWFVELQNQHGPQGLQIVAISLDDDASLQRWRWRWRAARVRLRPEIYRQDAVVLRPARGV